jgi:glutamate-1-semialdehyde 2,1-aminomutase
MVFRRFFSKDTPKPEPVEQDVDEAPEIETGEGEPEVEAAHPEWSARARGVLPTGASTGSKRPEALYGSADAIGPTHFRQAVGCRVIDTEGNEYIDCIMALGAVALGYSEPNVRRAALDEMMAGPISGLSSWREVELAERLCGVIPCADKVQFLKSGAEAMAAAVRIARTYTARDVVVGSGYFGWLDWCADDTPGVPVGTTDVFRRVPYDDVAALEQAVAAAGSQLAAIAIEPVVERLPSKEWITRARELATANGAVLIFDEIKTGFRLATAGYQQYAEIIPDLAAYGKAMSNGFALAAVCGQHDIMDAARNTWISSTLASEASALAAGLAVVHWHEQADICDSLWQIGAEMRRIVTASIEAAGVNGVTVDGIDPMWLMRFDEPARETRFLELAAQHGVLFKRGAYNFSALAHDDDALQAIEAGASAAFVDLRDEEARG